MKFATISTHHATSQPALVMADRVHTLPFPDMAAVIAAGAEAAASKASQDSLAIEDVKFLAPLKPNIREFGGRDKLERMDLPVPEGARERSLSG